MPEGDTIHRAAATLHRALAGATVVRFESVLPSLTRVHEDAPITGRTVDRVAAHGKHVLMHFSEQPRGEHPALVLRTHMRMNGSWHLYRPGERWRRPRGDMRVLVATTGFEAVAFRVPVAEFVPRRQLAQHRELSRLGPDLLAPEFDMQQALARLRACKSLPIGDALLNQRLLAGIGNVYRSEVLFACGVNPFATVQELDDRRLERLISTARRLLQANIATGVAPMTTYAGFRRTTGRDDPTQRLWVYGRAGRPCRKCGTGIQSRADGEHARRTYWCPRCQGSAA